MTKMATFTNREVLYANSMNALNERVKMKESRGYQLIGEMKQNLDGKWGCLVEKVIDLKSNGN